jgi:two-component system nitrate/nitrite response regulator NarL
LFHIFITSDVPLFRLGLVRTLAVDARLEVMGSADGWDATLRRLREAATAPDALLVDLGPPEGPHGLIGLAEEHPDLPVVALAGSEDEEAIIPWAEAGVSGLLGRRASLDELVRVVEAAVAGETACSLEVTPVLMRCLARIGERRSPEGRLVPLLTLREREIVSLIDEGLSNKEIARRLQIELPTVKNHVHHILRKLNASRRGEAAAMLRGAPRGVAS